MRDPDWLLDSEPREVQLEALRRSYMGYKYRDDKDDPGNWRQIREWPAVGWSHYMEMRLGKTPTVLNEFELFQRDHSIKRIVSIAPNTFKQGWVDEALKSGSSVPWGIWESNAHKEALALAKASKGNFGLSINYEALKGDNAKAFMNEWIDSQTMLVIDESIKIKDHSSLQTKLVLEAAKNAGVIRNLSGLPMTQGPQDLYTQFRAIRQLNGTNFYAFRNTFCKMGGFKSRKVVGARNPERLAELVDESSFVAKRKNWAIPLVPEYYVENLPMSDVQRQYYRSMDQEMTVWLDSRIEITVDMVITKLMKLQQISSGFIYTERGDAKLLMDPRKTAKMAKLLDMMEETDTKVIVPYHYGESGNALYECLGKWNPAIIRSSEWMKERGITADEEKKRFNHSRDCRVMILQISAGKYGHDLSGNPQDRSTAMVFYENTYSLDDRTQIEARNTSAFQDWTNTYHDFVCSPVEKAAVTALAQKENIVNSVLGAVAKTVGIDT